MVTPAGSVSSAVERALATVIVVLAAALDGSLDCQ